MPRFPFSQIPLPEIPRGLTEERAAPARASVQEVERPAARPTEQVLDWRGTLRRARRLIAGDAAVLSEVARDERQTLVAVLLAATAVLAAALGGWAWLALTGDGLSTGRVVIREFVLGGAFGLAAWVFWVIATHATLRTVYDQRVDRSQLLRAMGFAAIFAGVQLAMVVTPLSFAIGLIALGAWFLASTAAVEAAAPSLTRREALVSTGVGFVVFAAALSLLADLAGMAPGVFAHAADLAVYV